MRRFLICLVAGCALSTGAMAEVPVVSDEARTSIGLAIYNDGYGVVLDRRNTRLTPGRSDIRLTDISPMIQQESFNLALPEGFELVNLRRSLETLSPAALLKYYLGEKIRWITTNPATGDRRVETVTLVSLNGGTIIERQGRIEFNPPGRPGFPDIPAHLSGEPGLDATIATKAAGSAALDLTYITGGLVWGVDYVASLDDRNNRLRLDGYAGIKNTSGQDFDAATVSLIAGSVQRVSAAPKSRNLVRSTGVMAMAMDSAESAPVPEVSAVGDYHRYDLPEATDLKSGIANQMRLFQTASVPVRKVYRLSGRGDFIRQPIRGAKVTINPSVDLVFENNAEAGLGLPLPAGVIRVYSAPRDENDTTAVFLGENRIDHTAANEEISLSIGQAFDIVAERLQTEYRRIGNKGESESAHVIILRNQKEVGVTVEVSERFYGQWKVMEESQNHVRKDFQTAVWNVSVPAGGEAILEFKVNVRP